MLSDPDSLVIKQFGILNTLINEDDHPWFGIPFPGVYITDVDGVIQSKFFEHSLALRPGTDQLVRAVAGEEVKLAAASPSEAVTCEVSIDDAPVPPGVLRELRVSLRVPEGQHLYGAPVPSGMVATTVEIDEAEHLVVLDTVSPPTRPHVLEGTGEELAVFDGDVLLAVPFTHSAPLTSSTGATDERWSFTVSGVIRWQSCDDQACGLPASEGFSFQLSTAPLNRVSREQSPGGMDVGTLFHAMTERRA